MVLLRRERAFNFSKQASPYKGETAGHTTASLATPPSPGLAPPAKPSASSRQPKPAATGLTSSRRRRSGPAPPSLLPSAPTYCNSPPPHTSPAPSAAAGPGGRPGSPSASGRLSPTPTPARPAAPLPSTALPRRPRPWQLAPVPPVAPSGESHQGSEVLPAEVRLPQSHSRLIPRHLGPKRKRGRPGARLTPGSTRPPPPPPYPTHTDRGADARLRGPAAVNACGTAVSPAAEPERLRRAAGQPREGPPPAG